MQGFGETPHHQLWVSGWRHRRPSPRRPRGSCACVSGGGSGVGGGQEQRHDRPNTEKKLSWTRWRCLSTSFGLPPGFMAMALTNSGETQRTGERTGASVEGSSSAFCSWLSLTRRCRGNVAASSARACTPRGLRTWVLQQCLQRKVLLFFFHCRHIAHLVEKQVAKPLDLACRHARLMSG